MASPISSLGLGSSSNLNSETIDKLRKADNKLLVEPIEQKIKDYEQKIESVTNLYTILSDAKKPADALNDETLYLQRSVNVIGDGVTASVEDGVDPQNISIKVEQLAQEHVVQSDTFKSKDAPVAKEDTEVTIKIGDKSYTINIKAGMTLRDFVGSINQKAGADVSASILNTGKDEYRMILRSDHTGEDYRIEMTQGTKERTENKTHTEKIPLPIKKDPVTGEDLPQEYDEVEVVETVTIPATKLEKNLYNELQEPKNALFVFNGADIVRTSNTVDDMILGLSFTLNEVTGENKRVNINITQDTQQIKDTMQEFVDNYNKLMAQVQSMTKYDPDANEVGIFLGDNTINSVRSSLNTIMRSVNRDGESLANYGLSFEQSGTLAFDPLKFEQKLQRDPKGVQEFFRGKNETLNGKDLQKEGIFYKINLALDDLVNSADGSIVNFEKSLEKQLKRTEKEKKSQIERLDDRYETLTNQFAAADSAINKLNKSFESVNMQIKQSQVNKN